MEIRFNREREERKALVKTISEIAGWDVIYRGAPSFEFVVGTYIIDRYGTLSFGEGSEASEVQQLLTELEARGYVGEGITDLVMPSEPALAGDSEESAIAGDADTIEASTNDDATEVVAETIFTEESSDEHNGDTPARESRNEHDRDARAEESSNAHDGATPGEVLDDGHNTATPSNVDVTEVEDATVPSEEYAGTSAFGSIRSVVDDGSYNLTIEVPFVGFTTTALENLDRLVSGKAWLIMKALGTDALPIERTADTLRFSWFPVVSSHLEVDAYARLVHALCEMAKKQKRVTLKQKEADSDASEKFAFRCFLLRLGFIGKEYASARKILLSKLSGNGSFKNGEHKSRGMADATENALGGDEQSVAVIEHVGTETSCSDRCADSPLKCGICPYHVYSAEGELRTCVGTLVDTKKTPDKYTHYCTKVPSGLRKLKHAVDWSGGETAPKWCPLRTIASEMGNEMPNSEGVAV